MEESEITKIVEKTLKSSEERQIPKMWFDPKKAYSFGMVFLGIAIITTFLLAFVVVTDDIFDDHPLVNSLLEGMNCQSLKNVMNMPDLTYLQTNLIKHHLLIECL